MMSILPVFAQNSHWEYQGIPATSAVTVVHSNGVAYLFQSDGGRVYVTELDPTYMTVMNPSNYQSIQNVVLQGGYEDIKGDIVIYGSMGDYPVAALYDVITQQITNVFYDLNHQYDYFINGCCGYDINGQIANMLVLESRGTLVGFDWNNVIDTLMIMNNSGRISDVLWDPNAACFAVTGYNFNPAGPQLFLVGIKFDVNNGFILNPINSTAWYLPNLIYPYFFAEYRTCLEILPNVDFVVGQSIRDNQTDWLWLTTVSGYSGINNAAVFQIPSQKLWVLDMKHKDDLDKLVILGKINHSCGNIHYIAQVDPYSLTSMTVAQVTGYMPYTICGFSQNLFTNDIVLQKLEVNPISCPRILATGTYANSEAYMTETFDIANSSCDWFLKIPDTHLYPILGNMTCVNTGVALFPTLLNIPLNNLLNLSENWSCPDPMPCTKQGLKMFSEKDTNHVTVEWDGKDFLQFIGFSGEVFYTIYDVLGRHIEEGRTCDFSAHIFLPKSGIYIVKAEDYDSNYTTKKIVFMRK